MGKLIEIGGGRINILDNVLEFWHEWRLSRKSISFTLITIEGELDWMTGDHSLRVVLLGLGARIRIPVMTQRAKKFLHGMKKVIDTAEDTVCLSDIKETLNIPPRTKGAWFITPIFQWLEWVTVWDRRWNWTLCTLANCTMSWTRYGAEGNITVAGVGVEVMYLPKDSV